MIDSKETDDDVLDNLYRSSVAARSGVNRVRRMLNSRSMDQNHVPDQLLSRVSSTLEDLSARISVLEYLEERRARVGHSLGWCPVLVGELDISCVDLDDRSLYPPETDEDGRLVRWTMTRELNVDLPVYRNVEKSLRIFFGAIVDPGYSRSLEVLIDGERVRHRLVEIDDRLCLECQLEPGANLAVTRVTIRLPDAHAPSSQGESEERRVLGIAVTGLSVREAPRSLITRLMQRLTQGATIA